MTPLLKRRIVQDPESGTRYWLSGAELLDLRPFALFSERRAMEKMGPFRLALHLLARTIYYAPLKNRRLNGSRAERLWMVLWRLERRTWRV